MTPIQMHLAHLQSYMPAVAAHIGRTLHHPTPGANRVGGGTIDMGSGGTINMGQGGSAGALPTPPSVPSPPAGGSPRDAKA